MAQRQRFHYNKSTCPFTQQVKRRQFQRETERERGSDRGRQGDLSIFKAHSCPGTASVLDPDGALGTRWGFFNLSNCYRASIRSDLNWVTLRIYTINVKKATRRGTQALSNVNGHVKRLGRHSCQKPRRTTTKPYTNSHMSIICNPISMCV